METKVIMNMIIMICDGDYADSKNGEDNDVDNKNNDDDYAEDSHCCNHGNSDECQND